MSPHTAMNDPKPIPVEHNLQLLEAIDQNPQVTQADLAAQLGVAVGTINWYVKRLIARGSIKIRRMQRRRLLYLITPRGMAEKSRLAALYMQASFQVYRRARAQATQLLAEARQAGYEQILIEGDGELAEICRLTCLEQGMPIRQCGDNQALPILRSEGMSLKLIFPLNPELPHSLSKR